MKIKKNSIQALKNLKINGQKDNFQTLKILR